MSIKHIDVQTAKQWLDSGEALLIDVREPVEHAALSIDGAKLAPLSRLSADDVPAGESKKVIIHCKSGQRSQTDCKQFMAAHPDVEIYNLEGGILAWQHAGHDVKKKLI